MSEDQLNEVFHQPEEEKPQSSDIDSIRKMVRNYSPWLFQIFEDVQEKDFIEALSVLRNPKVKPIVDFMREINAACDEYEDGIIDRGGSIISGYTLDRKKRNYYINESQKIKNLVESLKARIMRDGEIEIKLEDYTEEVYRNVENKGTLQIEGGNFLKRGKNVLYIQPESALDLDELMHEFMAWAVITDGFSRFPKTNTQLTELKEKHGVAFNLAEAIMENPDLVNRIAAESLSVQRTGWMSEKKRSQY